MAQHILAARIREEKGKEASKRLRNSQLVPAIFYGPDTNPLMLTVESSDLNKLMKKSAGENIILGLQIQRDKGSDSKMVMLKELQTDPIEDTYLHADFYEISMDKEQAFDIPIRLVNIPKGVTDGGILQHVRREITVSCLPDKLVETIDVDVSELDIGESLHIKDIDLPESIKPLQEEKLTVAVVIAPAVITEEEEEVEEIEGEVEEKAAEEEGAESKAQDE
ncbi:50S ribosomal protein L25 [Thermodesulfobacteriota bacterium]